MNRAQAEWAELSVEEARERVVANFDKLIHDLHCTCELANLGRAGWALDRCGWTTKDAFEAWYVRFLGTDADA